VEITVKQRLAGAIVLIALGVIFIPMLLDGAGMKEKDRLELRMPPKPKYDFPRHIEELPLPESTEEDVPVSDKPAPAGATSDTSPVSEARPEKTVKVTPKIKEPVKQESEPAVPASRNPGLDSYVIQVGSFGDRKNALLLRDKLRKSGFTAFVESAKAQGKVMTRVKVGPVVKREEAESLLKRLDKEMKLQGQIIKD
jgi:DedD protein